MDDLFGRITDAHARIRPLASVTPLERSLVLSAALGAEVLLKAEHLQPTGSFKIRGAANKMRLLGPDCRAAGVVTASSGNHGLAVAHAGARLGVPVTVFVAATASPLKMAGIEALGARLVTVDGPPIAAERAARAAGEKAGKPYISPYNDIDIIAGQGTAGLELAEQCPDLDAVYVAVGGGGLIGGVGAALKRLRPAVRVIGVWPENSPCMMRAVQAGRIVDVEESATVSDGTAGAVEPGAITLPLCRSVIDEMMTVSETEIAVAMRRIGEAERWMIEGAAGVAVAGLMKHAPTDRCERRAAILCGRNIKLDTYLATVGAAR